MQKYDIIFVLQPCLESPLNQNDKLNFLNSLTKLWASEGPKWPGFDISRSEGGEKWAQGTTDCFILTFLAHISENHRDTIALVSPLNQKKESKSIERILASGVPNRPDSVVFKRSEEVKNKSMHA